MTTNENTPEKTPTPAEARETVWNLIKDIKFAMFTTRHPENGHLHARPMTTQNSKIDDDRNLWFFMSKKSDPVTDLADDAMVNVAYADPGKDSYVSITGVASVVEDAGKKQQLWSKATDAWFSGGPSDPDVALVQVRIVHANYWDVKESKVTQLYEMAKATVTGKPPTHLGEHAEVRMS